MKKLMFASLLWAAFVNYSVCQSQNENQSIEESLESLKWNFAGPTAEANLRQFVEFQSDAYFFHGFNRWRYLENK